MVKSCLWQLLTLILLKKYVTCFKQACNATTWMLKWEWHKVWGTGVSFYILEEEMWLRYSKKKSIQMQ